MRTRKSTELLTAFLTVAAIATVTPRACWSQQVTAAIIGKISDPSGASVPNAAVTATDTERGSTWTTFHLAQADVVAEMIGIPDGVTQVSLIPLAYTKGQDFRPASRPPVTEITHWNRWGSGVDAA